MRYKDFLASHPEFCPFCVPDQRLFAQNDAAFLTYALAPYHPHHLLVASRRHLTSILDLSESEAADLWKLVHLGIAVLQKLGYENYSVLLREGNKTGKSIPHLHYHLIPNDRIGDLDTNADNREVLTKEEASALESEVTVILKQIA